MNESRPAIFVEGTAGCISVRPHTAAYEGSKFIRLKTDIMSQPDGFLDGIRRGDADEFEALYDRHARLVFGIAFRIIGDRAAAEDVLQSVFMKIWDTPHSFRGGNFTAWLCRVTRNRALDMLRKSARVSVPSGAAESLIDDSFNERMATSLDGKRLRDALAKLVPEQRVPIELGFFEGISHEEISRRLSTPLGTIKTRIRSGLRCLREAMGI